jgi:PmbA protein
MNTLVHCLEKAQQQGELQQWLCTLTYRESLSIGLQNGQIGGVYNPPNKRREQNAKVLLALSNGKVVRTSLSRQEMQSPALFSRLKQIAIEEKDSPLFPEKKELPLVRIFCPQLKEQVDGKASAMIHFLQNLQKDIEAKTSLSGNANVRYTHLKTLSSQGWELESESTFSSVSASVDGLGHFSSQSRTLLNEEVLHFRARELSESVKALHHPVPKPQKAIPIGFSSYFTGSLMDKFLCSNLFARSLALGLSAFSPAQVEQQELLFAPDLSLRFDALRDFHAASFRLNDDGTVGQNIDLIQEGRLVRPIADLKGASMLHCTPTPQPQPLGFVWSAQRESHFSQVDTDFIFCDGALGLHSQDSTTGSFTLAVPHAAYVSKGKVIGRCPGRIQGNMFELLKLPLHLLHSDLMDGQGLLLESGIQFTPDEGS